MEIGLATVGHRTRSKGSPSEALFDDYCQRIGRYVRCGIDSYATEERFLAAIRRPVGRVSARKVGTSQSNQVAPLLTLLDRAGRSFSSEQLARWLQQEREKATRILLFAVGPADGWSDAARESVSHGRGLLLSLGPMTLPHELAVVVVAEQIYRAFTIIEGHPYHLGHA
ncbi:MAG: 23S rRNA (pseudouridine(1915)-N(3))-methyltransferase RlmH [Acidobacteriaceae bacterium]